ncbi:MAG: DUF1761 domain-containing protein [bacterium]|nr:DUF1761 domain-containing protein [bacterium]
MPVVTINYLAVLLCAIASMVLGSLWYGPLFGKQWVALAGITPEQMERGKRAGMWNLYALALIGALVMAHVLAFSLAFASSYFNATGVFVGLMAGFWNWLGFIAPVTLGSVLWEGKSWKLWILNNAYQLVLLLIMGVILAVWV